MKEAVAKCIDEIRPKLQADGGDVELVECAEDSGLVKVRLKGACFGCPMAQVTLKNGIEAYIKENVPNVVSVDAVD